MKITLAALFVSNSTDFRQIGSCSALFLSQITEIDRDRSENFIHHSSCLVLGSRNIVSIVATMIGGISFLRIRRLCEVPIVR
jgi:hypothetical protein